MFDLYDYSLLTIFLAGLAIIVVGSEIGRQLGVRAVGRGRNSLPTLEGAIFGILALIIGFTFAMALSRFDARRDAVVSEANAIGTTALRARLLPEPYRPAVLKLLQQYVKIRLDITQRSASRMELAAAIDRSNALQEALWQQAMAVAAKDNGLVPTGLFIQALNDMIDNQERRLTALRNRVPNIVMLALFGMAVIASAFAGYASGLEVRRTRLPIYIAGSLIVGVILLILDLDRPNTGFIEVSQQPIIDTAASIASFAH